MESKERIIAALDVDNINDALFAVDELLPYVGAFKIGLELITSVGAPRLIDLLHKKGCRIFFDGKFMDIPNTVAGAVRIAVEKNIWMLNLHALGGKDMMSAAVNAAEKKAKGSRIKRPIILAVTILTSMNKKALHETGIDSEKLEDEVVKLARLAKNSGLDGVVASAKETRLIREECGNDFIIVTPGIRPPWAASDDQKRIVTPKEAIDNGSDYLVIGRPIMKPPADIGTPANAAKKIVEEIKNG